MNQNVLIRIVLLVISIYLAIPIINIFAKAYNDSAYKIPDAYDLWTVDKQKNDSFFLYDYLSKEGFIANGVSFQDFDYIYVLTNQLCTMTKSVKPEMALAMIAVESNFDKDCKTGSARGLMQIIPIYHSKRMQQYVEEGHQINLDDFFDIRLNIMTGIDYMDELLEKTNGDIAYALMCYNQGPQSARVRYLEEFRVSSYAKKVMNLSYGIETFLGREDSECS